MDNGDWPKVRREAERQLWKIEHTAVGYRLKAPDGVHTVLMHRLHASSHPHALERTVQRMRRLGFQWPPPRGRR